MMNDTAKRRRIKIGLLVSHLEDDFDDAVAEGAMIGAEQCDADLILQWLGISRKLSVLR